HVRFLSLCAALRRGRAGAAPHIRLASNSATYRSAAPIVPADRHSVPRSSGPWYARTCCGVTICEHWHAPLLPVLLKGPSGCGKTRFVEHMAWRLGRPLITVSCHNDMTASDLLGRFLIDHESTRWSDGPLTRAVREGALCYLDEVVEA